MMRRWTVAVALAGSLLGAIPAGPAGADHGGGCGGDWSGSQSCPFNFRGFPIDVFGESSASGTASVRAWVTVPETGQVVAECSASGSSYATCRQVLGPQLDLTRPLTVLQCHVRGRQSGKFWCQSGLGF